jgi:hypothetical protein
MWRSLDLTAAEQALRNRKRFFWGLVIAACAVVGLGSVYDHNKPAANDGDNKPVANRGPILGGDPVARCSEFLSMLDVSGVDIENAVGAPKGMFGRAHWCLDHQSQFQKNFTAQPQTQTQRP